MDSAFLLSILIWLPILGGIALLLLAKENGCDACSRTTALLFSIATFALSLF